MSKETDSKITKHKLYWEIRKGRRSSLGNRLLTHLWPSKSEQKKLFIPRFCYSVTISPGDTAGHHYHSKKQEIFCPIGKLEMLLKNPKTRNKKLVKMNAGTKNIYKMYYIPVGVSHAIRNKTSKSQMLVVLVNSYDLYSNTFKHKIDL